MNHVWDSLAHSLTSHIYCSISQSSSEWFTDPAEGFVLL